MKRPVPRFLLSLLVPLSLLYALAAFGGSAHAASGDDLVPSRGARLAASCNCDSGYGLEPPSSCGSGYSRSVQRMFDDNEEQMISCCRPREIQDYLIRCYNACGQPGRAVKNSRHTTGHACDTTSTSIGRRYGLQYVPHHGSNHWQD